MATKSAGSSKSGARRVTGKKKKNTIVRKTAISLLLIAAGIFYFLSLVSGLTGKVGTALQQVTLGLFGISGYLLPLVIVYAGIQLVINSKKLRGRLLLSGFFLLMISAFYNIIRFSVPSFSEGMIFSDYFVQLTTQLYNEGYKSLSSGGVLGGYIAVPLTALCSKIGAGIIIFAIIALTVVIVGRITYLTFASAGGDDKKPVKQTKAVEKEIKKIRKDVDEIKSRQDKTEAPPASKNKKPSTEQEVDKALDDIEKPYKEAAKKFGFRKKSSPENAVTELTEPSPATEEAQPPEEKKETVTQPLTEENAAVTGNEDDLLIPPVVKPRKNDTTVPVNETIVDDPLRELIFKKVNEATEKENALETDLNAASPSEKPAAEEIKEAEAAVKPVEIDAKKPETAADGTEETPSYINPPISLLNYVPKAPETGSEEELQKTADKLMEALRNFDVETKVLNVTRGPTITRYELQPLPGVKISRITNLADDIALHLAATGVRLEAPIPGKAAIGVEIPNKTTGIVYLEELINSDEFRNAKSALSVCLGKDIGGNNIVIDLARMPHLLIAGATGSGKSVCINSLIVSLLYKSAPEDVRLILVDPKVVELNIYNGIPHLLIPVVTDPKKAAGALSWAVSEMLKRYDMFKEKNVRDFAGYNKNLAEGESRLPQIVIIIDEMADLMMTASHEVEDAVCRLAQMARAAGMHLVIATQRPSVKVITGTIKANVPSRIAFAVSSGVDSRIIIDSSGAEKLIGKGDMLYDPLGATKPLRVQGCFVSDKEVEAVIEFIKLNRTAEYDDEVIKKIEQNAKDQEKSGKDSDDDGDDDDDVMLPQAIEVVVDAGQASTSTLQRKLKLGYARAARIMDQMEERGIIGPYQGSKPRDVLLTRQQWLEMKARSSGKFD